MMLWKLIHFLLHIIIDDTECTILSVYHTSIHSCVYLLVVSKVLQLTFSDNYKIQYIDEVQIKTVTISQLYFSFYGWNSCAHEMNRHAFNTLFKRVLCYRPGYSPFSVKVNRSLLDMYVFPLEKVRILSRVNKMPPKCMYVVVLSVPESQDVYNVTFPPPLVCPFQPLLIFANFLNRTKHPWLKGISSLFKWRPRPFPRGDNYEIVKIHWRNLKIFFSRTTGPISTKLGTKHPCVKGI